MARNGTSSGRDERRGVAGTLALVLVLALVAGGVLSWRNGWLDRWLPQDDAALTEPAAVAPPPGLDLPPVRVPDAVVRPSGGDGTGGSDVAPAAVRAALAPHLRHRGLGPHVLAEVAPLDGGPPVFTQGTGGATPASTTKLVTATAALLALGPDHEFGTDVVLEPGRDAGPRRVVLVGGGDPYLMRTPRAPDGSAWPYPVRADLQTLAERTAEGLLEQGVRRVRLGYDTSLFSGPAVDPTWEPDYVPDGVVSPTTALWVDQGRPLSRYGRVADPALDAAQVFAAALAARGVAVVGPPAATTATDAADPVAAVASAPLGQVVERVIDVSDNEGAEALLRHVGLATTGRGSIQAGRDGVRSLLAAEGVRLGASTFHDGSGLSRRNVADPSTLVEVLRLAADPDRPDLRPVVAGLPVAGFTGSLATRMDQGPQAGLGRVRAKTGTLTGVTSLAGLATDLDGNVLVFALMADRVRLPLTLEARASMDSGAAALGACACSR